MGLRQGFGLVVEGPRLFVYRSNLALLRVRCELHSWEDFVTNLLVVVGNEMLYSVLYRVGRL